MSEFYQAKRHFFPRYGDIDWSSHGNFENAEQTIWFRSENGTNQECTQENTEIYISQLDNDTDAVSVEDIPRHAQFLFFRYEVGNDQFNNLTEAMQRLGACVLHVSMYPNLDLVDIWLERQDKQVEEATEVPTEWLSGEDT